MSPARATTRPECPLCGSQSRARTRSPTCSAPSSPLGMGSRPAAGYPCTPSFAHASLQVSVPAATSIFLVGEILVAGLPRETVDRWRERRLFDVAIPYPGPVRRVVRFEAVADDDCAAISMAERAREVEPSALTLFRW